MYVAIILTQCDPDGRQGDDQHLVFVDTAVQQAGSDPLLVLDDVM